MDLLERIRQTSKTHPDRIAMQWREEKLTYGELELYSSRLAAYIEREWRDNHSPAAVYGHKHPWMLVSFLALVKSGRGYCPIDTSVPRDRIGRILGLLEAGFCMDVTTGEEPGLQAVITEEAGASVDERDQKVLVETSDVAKEPCGTSGVRDGRREQILTLSMIKQIAEEETEEIDPACALKGEDIYYMIFTSGSTGTPKGVMITRDNLEHYLDWSVTLGGVEKEETVFLNQAPFSFDLSVMDLYTCLVSGGTLWALDKETQQDYRLLYDSLGKSGISIFVSTPSFAEVCMSDPVFCEQLMPKLGLFLFCGETLTNQTVKKLRRRFPKAKIVNTYGPTESTVAVTDVLVDERMAEEVSPLPVGRPKPGTRIEILDADGNLLPDGEKGEIQILGDTVSAGYYRNADGTARAFYEAERDGRMLRGYHTGDEGYLKDGMLYYCGRIDLQIKLHGYRIEIEDIENNIVRIPGVRQAAVVPNIRKGAVKSLTAYVVAETPEIDVREELLKYLPAYMIPKKIVFLDQLPMTNNGKVDRKQLGG